MKSKVSESFFVFSKGFEYVSLKGGATEVIQRLMILCIGYWLVPRCFKVIFPL